MQRTVFVDCFFLSMAQSGGFVNRDRMCFFFSKAACLWLTEGCEDLFLSSRMQNDAGDIFYRIVVLV